MRRAFAGLALVAAVTLVWLFYRPEAPLPRSALTRSAPTSPEPSVLERPRPSDRISPAAIPPPPAPSSRFQPRDPEEWQGMLLDTDPPPPCEAADGCGLARACKGGKCVACELDSDCASGEGCVLDHCLRKEHITCRRRADCDRESLCILSGYTSKRRGNEDMRSFCAGRGTGANHMPNTDPPATVDTRKSLPNDDLLKRANESLNAN
jgi:hypothetical protein